MRWPVLLIALHCVAASVGFVGEDKPGRTDPPPRPEALQRLEQARRAIKSGTITWQESGPSGSRAYTYVSRYAKDGGMIFEKRGNADGWVSLGLNADGKLQGYDRHPQLIMLDSVGWWEAKEGRPIVANVWRQDMAGDKPAAQERRVETLDVRYAGISYAARSLRIDEGFAMLGHDQYYPVKRWNERCENGRVIVTAEAENGGRLRWEINPEKGWNAEYIEVAHSNLTVGVRCTLKQYDNVWLPETSEYFVGEQRGSVIRILDAALNRDSDPERFTPADLRLEPGAEIRVQPLAAESVDLVWNGETIYTRKEWDADLKAGRRHWGPAATRMHEVGFLESPYDTPEIRQKSIDMAVRMRSQGVAYKHVLMWYKYVNSFIDRYQLSPEQIEKAWSIRRECEKLAKEHIQRHADAFKEVGEGLVKLRAETPPNREKIDALEARLQKLSEPIDRIFETQLVPRLDKLPTREQRARADEKAKEAATSAPTADAGDK